MQAKNELCKKCSHCNKSFLIKTHFQSNMKQETKKCQKCRKTSIKSNNNPTSKNKKRKYIYLSHKKTQIENSRGCQWPEACRFKFSDNFVVCDQVDNIAIFEFDHLSLDEKSFCVSNWPNNSKYTVEDLIDESAKCRILCRFHHNIHSQNRCNEKKKGRIYSNSINAIQSRKNRQESEDKLNKLKLKFGKCEMCERPVLEAETTGFDFDHIIRVTKYHDISFLTRSTYSWENTILPEIEKCRLLCAICHTMHTLEQG